MLFGNKILEYKDEFMADLKTLLRFESVDGANNEECKNALDFILQRAQDFGLCAEQVTDKSAHVTLGDKGKLCGVLSHLDVVPAGGNWTVPAFDLTEKDGRLYGRGIADDKGASLINLYCLRALKESGVEGKNTVRAIYGIAEETGMEDMDGYFEVMPVPDMSFTPDSEYGIGFAEKGILHFKVSSKNNAKVLTQFHAGNAVNAVPDKAYAIVDSSSYDESALVKLANESKGDFEFQNTIDGLMIVSKGVAAHACMADKGLNAASALVELLSKAYSGEELGSVCEFLNYAVHNETDGRSFGLKMSDCVSGPLTLNLGIVDIEEEVASAQIDIRYPVTVKGDFIIKQFKKVAKNSNLEVEVTGHEKPLYVEKDSALVQLLSEAYESVTGEKAELYTTGGGTYARKLGGKGVGFGPVFSGEDVHMHNADESMDKENFFKHAQICLEALYRMYID